MRVLERGARVRGCRNSRVAGERGRSGGGRCRAGAQSAHSERHHGCKSHGKARMLPHALQAVAADLGVTLGK